MSGAATQQLLVGPDNPFFHVGLDIADGLQNRVSGFRNFLRHKNFGTICHDLCDLLTKDSMFLLYHFGLSLAALRCRHSERNEESCSSLIQRLGAGILRCAHYDMSGLVFLWLASEPVFHDLLEWAAGC